MESSKYVLLAKEERAYFYLKENDKETVFIEFKMARRKSRTKSIV